MPIRDELLDESVRGYKKPEGLIGENGLLKDLTKLLFEKALHRELTHHSGHPKPSPKGMNKKKIKGELGELEIEVFQDRNAEFKPVIIPKGQSRFSGFDETIISLYARGMSTGEIQGHLKEIY